MSNADDEVARFRERITELDRQILDAVNRRLELVAVLKRYKDAGITTIKLSPEILASLKRATDEVLSEESAKDALFKKVLESQKAFQTTYKPWQRLAYLPADQK